MTDLRERALLVGVTAGGETGFEGSLEELARLAEGPPRGLSGLVARPGHAPSKPMGQPGHAPKQG